MTPKLSAPWVLLASVILGLCLGAAMRVVRNPPVIAARTMEAHLTVPRDVENILTRSCKDCHSYETRWPWYSRLPFVSGVVGKDVKRARSYMNISDWSATIAKGKGEEGAALNGICEELRSDSMPLIWYRRIHQHTHLTATEVEAVCKWTEKTAAASLR
jgi:Haem-binding domain